MREVSSIYFAGSGDHSIEQAKRLHDRLDYALNLIGGMQQPSHNDIEDGREEEFHEEIRHIAEDLYCALTGNDPEITQHCLACGEPVTEFGGLKEGVTHKHGGFVCSDKCWALSDYVQCGSLVGEAWNKYAKRVEDRS